MVDSNGLEGRQLDDMLLSTVSRGRVGGPRKSKDLRCCHCAFL